ncbi:MAG: TatD family hydrolase [Candidatus Aenigmarchaeota archaeon]|nr:TatD family hydrolase [Candidatus Aenigmarchaeota archaeon]
MIDVHCHLEHEKFRNNKEIIQSFRKYLKAIITSSPHPKDFEYTLNLKKEFEGFVFACVGLHPEYIEEFSEETLDNFEEFVKTNKNDIISIGEIGLDYFWIKDEKLREKQKWLFEKLIEFAKSVSKPITVHIRDAYEDALKILEGIDYQKVHLHMFGGDKFLDKVLANEWKISVGPILLRSKTHKKIVKKLPLERIMLETDSPWIKIDGKESMPIDVKIVAEKIAEVKNVSLEEVERKTDENAISLFKLELLYKP